MNKKSLEADIVVIGVGGIVGAMLSKHLIQAGWKNIVGVDMSAMPTDIGSTSHASDFCFHTTHDWRMYHTTRKSREFYQSLGHYSKVGGLEIARKDDDKRMEELVRLVDSGISFGSELELISARKAKELIPLLNSSEIQGALYDPHAGLITPRSQRVAGEVLEWCANTGKIEFHVNTQVLGIDRTNNQVCGIRTSNNYIHTNLAIVSTGIWGQMIAEMVDEKLPLWPFQHPLMFFGPFNKFAGTGKKIGYPLIRDQGNSSYFRDTGDPSVSEGGRIQWGYYDRANPKLVKSSDIKDPKNTLLSPSMMPFNIEQIIGDFDQARNLLPILDEIGLDQSKSFNGLMSVTNDGNPLLGETLETPGLWYCEAINVKDAPQTAKLLVDWLTYGKTEIDISGFDIKRFHAEESAESYSAMTCSEKASQFYDPPPHPKQPVNMGLGVRYSPFFISQKELGATFINSAGWQIPNWYDSNRNLVDRYRKAVPKFQNEWEAKHRSPIAYAEVLEMTKNVGMVDLSNFTILEVSGKESNKFLDYIMVDPVPKIGRGTYTHFLDRGGLVRSDLTVIHIQTGAFWVVSGARTGMRDLFWLLKHRRQKGYNVKIRNLTNNITTIGLWGPKARDVLQSIINNPESLDNTKFPIGAFQNAKMGNCDLKLFRISYAGELGWEIYSPIVSSVQIWDKLLEKNVTPIGMESIASIRRLEKGFLVQGTDILDNYNLFETCLVRKPTKNSNFLGKTEHLRYHDKRSQDAYICTLVMCTNCESNGIRRYPVPGPWPILDVETNELLVDEQKRQSFVTSIEYGPTVDKIIAYAYLPKGYAYEGAKVSLRYSGQRYELVVAGVGGTALFDPSFSRMKG